MLEVDSFRAALHGGLSRRTFPTAGALDLRAGAAEPPSAKPASVILLWV